MRTTILATAASALAAAALLIGVGSAAAEPAEPGEQGRVSGLTPAGPMTGAGNSAGYGSFGTGSLMDVLSMIINTGSVVLSVDVPNSTGSYAPGSLGSYGPEAALGALSVAPIGSLAGAS